MTFDDLVASDAVFVDANILTYHFQPHPIFGMSCTQLLLRIENGQLTGLTSVSVLAEVAHRLMTIEASSAFSWPFAGIGNRLRSQPAQVQKLTAFRRGIEKVLQGNLQILTATPSMLGRAVVLSQQLGLLTNDALTAALMQANGLSKIASSDSDFDRVPGFMRYAPV